MGKSELVARVLGSHLTRTVWAPTDQRGGMLRILAYHRVLDDDPATFAFDEALISATSEAFARQMEFVCRNFEVITFHDLYDCKRAGRPWPRRAAIVTFDDGYRDSFTHAFPILKALHLPATVFLSTSYMGDCTRLFWWDLVAYCIKHSPRSEVAVPQVSSQPMPLGGAHRRRAAIQRILDWVKRVPEEEKNAFLAELAALAEVSLPADLPRQMHLKWAEVQAMAAAGIEFGSHSVTHPILANVSHEQLKQEIEDSKRIIEAHLGQEIVVIAYPDGRKPNYNDAVKRAAADAGFAFGLAYEEGVAIESSSDHLAIPRIHVEQDQTPSLFRANLMFPKVMNFRKNRS